MAILATLFKVLKKFIPKFDFTSYSDHDVNINLKDDGKNEVSVDNSTKTLNVTINISSDDPEKQKETEIFLKDFIQHNEGKLLLSDET